MSNQAFISLGTNIEPRREHLEDAIKLLGEHQDISIVKVSSIYETAPVGYLNQDDFLNMVIEIRTILSSIELLDYCQQIEMELGRKREIRFGPRTIDLDILIYNKENSTVDRLTIPHPRMYQRAFVLIPFNEVAPDLFIPNWDKRASELLNKLQETDIKGVRKWIQSGSEEE